MAKPYHSITKKERIRRIKKTRAKVRGIKSTYRPFLDVLSKLPPQGIRALEKELKKLTPKKQRDLRVSLKADRRTEIILSSPEMKKLMKSLTEREQWMVNCSFLDNPLVRNQAVKDLAETRKKKFIPVFEAKLKDGLWAVRRTALNALVDLKSSPLVMALLYDKEPEVRWVALRSLYGLRVKEAVPRIEKLLEKERNMDIRSYATEVLRAFAKL